MKVCRDLRLFSPFRAAGTPESQFRDGLVGEEWVVTDVAERLLLSCKGMNGNRPLA